MEEIVGGRGEAKCLHCDVTAGELIGVAKVD